MIIDVSIGIFIREIKANSCRLWMQKRLEKGPLCGLWEFPGGKIEKGESPKEALIREIKEEVGVDIKKKFEIVPFGQYSYDYLSRRIFLHAFGIPCEDLTDERHFDKGKWFFLDTDTKSQSIKESIPEANYQIIDDIMDGLGSSFSGEETRGPWI